MVRSVTAVLPLNKYFTQFEKIRDTSIEGLLTRIYENAFVEPQLHHRANKISINCDESQRNDRRFLDLIEPKAIEADGYF